MFKFDFTVNEIESENNAFTENKTELVNVNVQNEPAIAWYDSEEVEAKSEILENMDIFRLNSTEMHVGDITLTYMVSGFLLQDILNDENSTEDITKAEESHSDLIPGVYEGGAKLWECTEDLLKYMAENCKIDLWKNKRTLDLGCGSGVLGIYAYKNGANVHFQDYNKDVLEKITIPNVLLNIPKPPIETDLNLVKLRSEIQFYSGDWCKYSDFTKDNAKFDVILTSETIYNPSNLQKLIDTFHAKLTQEGIVLVAAKTYYFGVGGGLRLFENLIESDGRFISNVVWSSIDGVSREILELKRK